MPDPSVEYPEMLTSNIALPGDDPADTVTSCKLGRGAVAVNVNLDAPNTVDETRLLNNDDGAV